jgi:hypothetical protein
MSSNRRSSTTFLLEHDTLLRPSNASAAHAVSTRHDLRTRRDTRRVKDRRAALGALLAATGTALGLAGGQHAAAQPICDVNGQDCCKVNGKSCHSGDDCCSGRCVRRRGKKVCKQAGNQGWCEVGDDACTGSTFFCGTASDSGACVCFATTKGHSFCGNNSEIQPGNCDCTSGKECERRLGKGARCVRMGADCEGACPGATTGCMAPCPELDSSA